MVLLNLVVKPAWLLTENIVQDQVGHDDFGTYSALLSFGFLFLIFSDLGINQYATRSLASQPELMKSYFPNLLSFKVIITFLYPLLMVGGGWLIGYRGHELSLLLLVSVIHGGIQLIDYFRANFRAMQRFKIDGLASVMDRAVLLLLVWVLIYQGITIEKFVYARLISVGLTLIVAYLVIVKLYGWLRPRLNIDKLKELLRMSFPLALVMVLYSVHTKVDQVMLERISGSEEAGLYVGAYRWVDAITMYLWTVLPIFYARFALYIKDISKQNLLLKYGQILTALPMIFACLFVWFYGEKLLFLFGNSTEAEIRVMSLSMRILFIAVLLDGFFAIFSTLLTSTGHEGFVNRRLIFAIVLNIVLNAIFIPQYGAVASAWATAASYLFMSFSYGTYVWQKMPVVVPMKQMGALLFTGLVCGLAFYLLGQTALPWYGVSLISGLLLLICGLLLGLISKDLVSKLP